MLPVYLLISGKQFAEEAEVEEVHIQENFETPMMKCNDVREMDRWVPEVVVKLPIKMIILLFKLDVGRDR